MRESIFVKIRLISRISRILVDFAKISSLENYWKYWTYWQNFSFVPDSPPPLSDTLLLWSIWTYTVRESIFMKIRFHEFWSILQKLVPSKIIGNIWHIRKIFHFSLTYSPTPQPCSVTLIHFGHSGKIFDSSLALSPRLWLIHFGCIGKIFHFSLTPPALCDFDPFWIYWQKFLFFPQPLALAKL